MENQKIEYNQTLNKDDIIAYNIYVLSSRITLRINSIFLGCAAGGMGIFTIVNELITKKTVSPSTIIICSVLILLSVFCFAFMIPFVKLRIKSKINKQNNEDVNIYVNVSNEGLVYGLSREDNHYEDYVPYQWSQISKVIEKQNHLFLHINKGSVIIIKKDEDSMQNEMIEFIKTKLPLVYKIKK